MKRDILVLLITFSIIGIALATAGSFNIRDTGNDDGIIFTVNPAADAVLNVTGNIAEGNVSLSDIYLAISSFYDTNASLCGNGEYLDGSGTCIDLNATIDDRATGISSAEANTTYALNVSLLNYDVWTYNQTTPAISYADGLEYMTSTELNTTYALNVSINILDGAALYDTNASMCGDDEVLFGSGTCIDFNATVDDRDETGAMVFTNLAWINQTNTFTPDQIFSADINMTVTGAIRNGLRKVMFTATDIDLYI